MEVRDHQLSHPCPFTSSSSRKNLEGNLEILKSRSSHHVPRGHPLHFSSNIKAECPPPPAIQFQLSSIGSSARGPLLLGVSNQASSTQPSPPRFANHNPIHNAVQNHSTQPGHSWPSISIQPPLIAKDRLLSTSSSPGSRYQQRHRHGWLFSPGLHRQPQRPERAVCCRTDRHPAV